MVWDKGWWQVRSGSPAQRHRLGWRLVWHHLGLACVSVVLGAAIYAALPGPDEHFRLSMATAYVGLAFLAVTLLIGPLKVLRRQRGALSDDLRRDVGLWTALLGGLHVIVGIQVHMGSPWLYFFYGAGQRPAFWPLPVRIDVFGLANDTGLAATLILGVLLLASNDVSMRTLGNRWWKRVQQLNYGLLALVVLHGIVYQRIEGRDPGWVLLFWAAWLVAAGLQLVGFRIRSSQKRGRGSTLAAADLAESRR
ncbi:MAG: ferric reductase-like transmembrane domain-containing protein [Chloroflexota bacterium]